MIFIVEAVSVGLGIGAVIVLSSVYDSYHKSMSWFSDPWILLGIYVCPMVCVHALGPAVYLTIYEKLAVKKLKKSDEGPALKRSHQVQMFMHAFALILAVLLVILTLFGIQSAFILLLALIFYGVSLLLNLITSLQLRGRYCYGFGMLYAVIFSNTSDRSWVLVHLAGQLLPFLFYAYMCVFLSYFFPGIEGRAGPNSNPETTIAYFCIAFGTMLTGFIVPAFLLYKRPLRLVGTVAAMFLVGIIVMLSPLGFPYRPETSFQRQWIYVCLGR